MFGMIPFERRDNNLFDMLDSMEHNFFGSGSNVFRTDIRDEGDKFVLEAELPGFKKEDIKLHLKDGILTITAARTAESQEKNGSYVRRERRYGSFARTFDVTGIDEKAITASYENGILTLTLPKQVPVQPERRQIAIN